MPNKSFVGGAPNVAQVQTGSIDTIDATPANDTFSVTMGNAVISVQGDTDIATTATALRAALNDSGAHPYFGQVIWSGSGGDIIGTSTIPGLPFEATLSHSGGTGTVTDFAVTTANSSPHDASVAANYSDGQLPANGDTLILNGAASMLFGLDLSSITLAEIIHYMTGTGLVGLDKSALITSADGQSTNAAYPEYRRSFLSIGWDEATLGQQIGTGQQGGSARLRLKNEKAGASLTRVINTAGSGQNGAPAVQLIANHASADFAIRRCPGGVGINTSNDDLDATITVGSVDISTTQSNDRVFGGDGVTYGQWTQSGGDHLLILGEAALPTLGANGGRIQVEGDQLIAALTVTAGECYPNNVNSAGKVATAATLSGGTLDLLQSPVARQIDTLTLNDGAELKYDSAVASFGTINTPAGRRTLTVT